MKILSFNTGYFLGYSGTYEGYLKHPLRGLLGSGTEYDNLDSFVRLIEDEKPDLVLTQEVDGGSLRTSTEGQHLYLDKKLPNKYSSRFDSKYRGFLFPNTPMLKHMGNSVFYNRGSAEKHSLSIGRKNLVQEIRMDELSVFSLHLSTFGKWVRKRQIKQVAEIAKSREDYVIAGDLNLHTGAPEIEYLEKILESPVYSPGETFPAGNPTRKLDLVASSEDVKLRNLKDLGNRFSDHRPISFEISF